jgi:hypothetical protein
MPQPLPDSLGLREIKFGPKSTREQRIEWARRYLEAGRTAEALDLFLLANDEAGVSEMRRLAIEQGRPILLLGLQRAGRAVPAGEWSACGEVAFRDGRWREAFRAFSEAKDEPGLAKAREKLPGYEIYTPQGK